MRQGFGLAQGFDLELQKPEEGQSVWLLASLLASPIGGGRGSSNYYSASVVAVVVVVEWW